MRVGLISDTHGLLRPEAVAALAGSDFIVHAGDIGLPSALRGSGPVRARERPFALMGGPAILAELGRIAPVTAVRGNNDVGDWSRALPHTAVLEAAGVRIHVIHDVAELAVDPAAARFDVVVAGHSHRPAIHERGGVLFVNPGSAGPRRFSLPVSVGVLAIADGTIRPSLVTLEFVGPHACG